MAGVARYRIGLYQCAAGKTVTCPVTMRASFGRASNVGRTAHSSDWRTRQSQMRHSTTDQVILAKLSAGRTALVENASNVQARHGHGKPNAGERPEYLRTRHALRVARYGPPPHMADQRLEYPNTQHRLRVRSHGRVDIPPDPIVAGAAIAGPGRVGLLGTPGSRRDDHPNGDSGRPHRWRTNRWRWGRSTIEGISLRCRSGRSPRTTSARCWCRSANR